MKKRLLAVSDIHGQYKEFKELLKISDYDSKRDQLILLGDYVDRGPDSFQVIDLVMKLVSKGAVALLGNHDQMFFKYFSGELDRFTYYLNGGGETYQSYNKVGKNELVKHLLFLRHLPLIWETDKYYFVHAGLNPERRVEEQEMNDLLWIREEWLYSNRSPTSKIVVFGHSIVSYWFGSDNVYFGKQKIGINTGAGCGGFLSMVDLTNKITYSSAESDEDWEI